MSNFDRAAAEAALAAPWIPGLAAHLRAALARIDEMEAELNKCAQHMGAVASVFEHPNFTDRFDDGPRLRDAQDRIRRTLNPQEPRP